MPKVYISGYIDVPLDRLADVKNAMPDHIRASRSEPGCLFFELTHDADVPGRINVKEAFTSLEAFDFHQENRKDTHWSNITVGITRNFEISYE